MEHLNDYRGSTVFHKPTPGLSESILPRRNDFNICNNPGKCDSVKGPETIFSAESYGLGPSWFKRPPPRWPLEELYLLEKIKFFKRCFNFLSQTSIV